MDDKRGSNRREARRSVAKQRALERAMPRAGQHAASIRFWRLRGWIIFIDFHTCQTTICRRPFRPVCIGKIFPARAKAMLGALCDLA
jgi:hypothetical protein